MITFQQQRAIVWDEKCVEGAAEVQGLKPSDETSAQSSGAGKSYSMVGYGANEGIVTRSAAELPADWIPLCRALEKRGNQTFGLPRMRYPVLPCAVGCQLSSQHSFAGPDQLCRHLRAYRREHGRGAHLRGKSLFSFS